MLTERQGERLPPWLAPSGKATSPARALSPADVDRDRDAGIDSLTAQAVPAAALNTTITPPMISSSLACPPENFLVIDEHAAQSDSLSPGDQVVTPLPTGERIRSVVAAVVARGLNRDDTFVSGSLTGA
ncbi:hypothetical protein ABR738_02790 [Streptomyces sp. Edi4]|uniref:hypothetical protein n=1 Tax=Streptomyces sp. Edi4 TaxID=3162527 RepID=UPI003305664A